jgi:hypothetical protein
VASRLQPMVSLFVVHPPGTEAKKKEDKDEHKIVTCMAHLIKEGIF